MPVGEVETEVLMEGSCGFVQKNNYTPSIETNYGQLWQFYCEN